MIHIDIPGFRSLDLEHLVLDLNGTLAVDGRVLDGVAERLRELGLHLSIHVYTADTHGTADEVARSLGVQLHRLEPGNESGQKAALTQCLGTSHTVAIGNGANDAGMLSQAAVGISVLGSEGLATSALQAADIVVARIEDGLDLLLRPKRLIASLRQ